MRSFLMICGILASSIASAYDFTDYAHVLSAEPLYRDSPREDCWDEQVPVRRGHVEEHSALNAGTIIGGITGGLVGSRVGRGNGRTAATAVGAVTGALVGDSISRSQDTGAATTYRSERRCRPASEPQITGWRVTYEYAGHRETTVMHRDPGDRVRVGVSLLP